MVVRIIAFFLLMGGWKALWANEPAPRENSRSIWQGGQVYLIGRDWVEQHVIGKDSLERTLPPEGTLWTTVADDGSFWALGSSQGTTEADGESLSQAQVIWRKKSRDTKWERWGQVRLGGEDALFAFVPLDKDSILAFSKGILWESKDSLRNETQAVFVRKQGEVVLDHLVSLDLVGDPFLRWQGDPKAAPKGILRSGHLLSYNRLRHLWVMSFLDFSHPDALPPIWQAGGDLCVVNQAFGIFWVFNAKGDLARRISLFDLGSDEELARPSVEWQFSRVVLGCEPAQDGRLLVASRSLAAVVNERKTYPLTERGQPVPPGKFEGNARWGRLQFPEIWWWRVDPASGKAEKITPPPGAPLFLDENIASHGLDWTYSSAGDPVFPEAEKPSSTKVTPAASPLPGKPAPGSGRR